MWLPAAKLGLNEPAPIDRFEGVEIVEILITVMA